MNITYLLACVLCLSACNKVVKFNTHLYGQVLDADTRQPVAGIPVTLEYIGGNAGFGPNLNTYSYPSVVADNNGRYRFDFDSRSDGSHKDRYRLSGQSSDTYFGFGADIVADTMNNRTKTLNFDCYQRVYVSVKLLHDGISNPDDMINLNIYPYPYGYGISELQYGTVPEAVAFAEVVPNHPTRFKYFTKHSGAYSGQLMDSFTFTQNGQVYPIHY